MNFLIRGNFPVFFIIFLNLITARTIKVNCTIFYFFCELWKHNFNRKHEYICFPVFIIGRFLLMKLQRNPSKYFPTMSTSRKICLFDKSSFCIVAKIFNNTFSKHTFKIHNDKLFLINCWYDIFFRVIFTHFYDNK